MQAMKRRTCHELLAAYQRSVKDHMDFVLRVSGAGADDARPASQRAAHMIRACEIAKDALRAHRLQAHDGLELAAINRATAVGDQKWLLFPRKAEAFRLERRIGGHPGKESMQNRTPREASVRRRNIEGIPGPMRERKS